MRHGTRWKFRAFSSLTWWSSWVKVLCGSSVDIFFLPLSVYCHNKRNCFCSKKLAALEQRAISRRWASGARLGRNTVRCTVWYSVGTVSEKVPVRSGLPFCNQASPSWIWWRKSIKSLSISIVARFSVLVLELILYILKIFVITFRSEFLYALSGWKLCYRQGRYKISS